MHQGDWTCAACGKDIKELPFEPRNTDNLKCRDCHQKERGDAPRRDNDRGPYREGERKMFKGEWTCVVCSKPITELPFEPRHTDGLKCRDCLRA